MHCLLSAHDIVRAFIEHTALEGDDGRSRGTVSLGARGGARGYFVVEGPNAQPTSGVTPRVLVERYNAAVFFNHEGIARIMGADARPADKRIWEHPLGASTGTNLGAARWGLSPLVIAERFEAAGDLVAAIIAAYGRAEVAW